MSGIELAVSDDGGGMDLDIIMQTSTATSLGLTSMRERAELTGGSFSIESTPGEGTTIRAFWPIEAEDQLQKGLQTIEETPTSLFPWANQFKYPEDFCTRLQAPPCKDIFGC